jgi:hypothetical protein
LSREVLAALAASLEGSATIACGDPSRRRARTRLLKDDGRVCGRVFSLSGSDVANTVVKEAGITAD